MEAKLDITTSTELQHHSSDKKKVSFGTTPSIDAGDADVIKPKMAPLREKKLCGPCRRLDLRIEKFLVQGSFELSRRSSVLFRSSFNTLTEDILNSGSTKRRLGPLKDIIKTSDSCPFCWLVIKSIGTVNDPGGHTASCYTNWEIDGREWNRGGLKPRTRRIHVTWDDPKLKDSHLVFFAPEIYNIPHSDARENFIDEMLFLGRSIEFSSDKKSLMRSWLDLCCKSHGGPCKHLMKCTSDFGDMIQSSFFGVIDVVTMSLTSLPHWIRRDLGYYPDDLDPFHPFYQAKDGSMIFHKPYVALSYAWGPKGEYGSYMTNLSNVLLHRQPGGLEKQVTKFPKVTQDAINLVQRLGLRYLWVDHLCIVQNTRSFNLNCNFMDSIYGNAIVTICAADGKDNSAGLVAMHAQKDEGNQIIEECKPDVRLMVSHPPEARIRDSAWNSRAWTFQERLLSRRCLIFTEGRVYFQCRSTSMSEDIFADQKGAGWSLDLVESSSRILPEIHRRAVWFYLKSVDLYTARKISREGDILAAFKGISNLMEVTLTAPFVFGLPSSHFDLALLWEGKGEEGKDAIKRRDERNSAVETGNQSAYFPSWSWCGWVGATMHYHPDMTGDCVANLNEWLLNHTWISWFIRDGRGDLRPIWRADECTVDKSTEKRWRGYGTAPTVSQHTLRYGRDASFGPDEEMMLREELPDDRVDTITGPSQASATAYPLNGPEVERRRSATYPPQLSREDDDRGAPSFYRSHPGNTQQDAVLPPMPDDRGSRSGYQPPEVDQQWLNVITPEANPRRMDPSRRPEETRVVHSPIQNVGYEQQNPESHTRREINNERLNLVMRDRMYNTQAFGGEDHYRSDDFREIFPLQSDDPSRTYFYDEYGRRLPTALKRLDYNFRKTLSETPYRVTKSQSGANPNPQFPDQPILQFWTWHTFLYVIPVEGHQNGLLPGNRRRCNIADDNGDWCGTIVLGQDQIADHASARHEFIAISEAKSFTQGECETWTYYVPKEREDSEWELLYVLLLKHQNHKWQRVGLGKVFTAAFSAARWREIILE